MWLQINPAPRTRRMCHIISALLCMMILSGCGYQLASREKGIFNNSSSTLRISSVENPTMYTWLPHRLRSYMRDEINKRKLATWVDSSPSDYSMRIAIKDFTLRSYARDSSDTTVLYSAVLSIEATVYDGTSNRVIWRSGTETISRTYDSKDEQSAGSEVTQLIIQRVADRMRHSF